MSLPPLFFSDTEKLTLPPPSLLTCFCPPFPDRGPYSVLFLAVFYHCISICISQPNHPQSISISALSSLLSCVACTPSSLSLSQCRCFSAASTENWFCLQIHCMLLSPLSIHCSLHHSPSLFFSQHHSLGTHFFSFSVFHVAFPPLHIHLCALIHLFDSNFMCISTIH